MLQYILRGYILGSGAPGTPVVMRQLQVHFVTITVESFKLYCQKYHNLLYESACCTLKLCKINKSNYQNLKHLSVCTTNFSCNIQRKSLSTIETLQKYPNLSYESAFFTLKLCKINKFNTKISSICLFGLLILAVIYRGKVCQQ